MGEGILTKDSVYSNDICKEGGAENDHHDDSHEKYGWATFDLGLLRQWCME